MSIFGTDVLFQALTVLAASVPTMGLRVAEYVLSALGIYTIARRRGLRRPWLAWVPVVNVWLLGSLSDQYRYVVKGENRSKRKWLLALTALRAVFVTAALILGAAIVGGALSSYHFGPELFQDILGPALVMLGLALPLLAVVIAFLIIRYMALYDVYKSLDPDNSVLFLVLSICIGITEPFFLFFNRNKDKGMPPRKPEYQEPQQTEPEPQPEQPLWQEEADKGNL